MRVIQYCRVSSDDQAEGTSLDYQERVLREYCARKGYEVVMCCREDYTAKHHDYRRPEMKKIRDYCFDRRNRGKVDLILFLRWDRFSRDTEFALRFKREFLDERGIQFNAIENPIDFESTEWSFLLSTYCSIAQTENNKISRRTRDGIRETLKKGKCANKAPRGYKNVQLGKHDKRVEVDANTAPLIQSIFLEVAKGLESPFNIRKRLAPHISKSSFFHMLRNIFYIGKVRVPATKNETEVIVVGEHEPLITEEVFWRVQEILDGKRKKSPKLGKPINPDLYLRKFLKCPICGHSITGAPSRGNGGVYTYYHCSKEPKHIRVRADEVNRTFAGYLSCLKPNETVLKLYLEVMEDIQGAGKRERAAEIAKIELEKEKLDRRCRVLENKYLDGELDVNDYKGLSERIKKEISNLDNRIQILKTPNKTNLEPKLEYTMSLINNIDKYIRDAPVALKIKLLGSMFYEKIEFDGKNYRTTSYNQVLDLIYQQTNELRGGQNEKGESFSTLSHSVPRIGLEPTCREALAPETSVSTISPSGHRFDVQRYYTFFISQHFFVKKEKLNAENFYSSFFCGGSTSQTFTRPRSAASFSIRAYASA